MQASVGKDHLHEIKSIGSLGCLSCVVAVPFGERPKSVSFLGQTCSPSEAAPCVTATRCKNSDTISHSLHRGRRLGFSHLMSSECTHCVSKLATLPLSHCLADGFASQMCSDQIRSQKEFCIGCDFCTDIERPYAPAFMLLEEIACKTAVRN